MNKEQLFKTWKQKGFYIMLLLCIVVISVTISTLSSKKNSQIDTADSERIDLNKKLESTEVNNKVNIIDNDKQEKSDKAVLANSTEDVAAIEGDKIVIDKDDINKNQEDESKQKANTTEKSTTVKDEKKVDKTSTSKKKVEESVPNTKQNKTTQKVETKSNPKTVNEKESTKTEQENKTAFTKEDKMSWPVDGDVVMGYSVDKTIYDSTLDQYRTNDSISIKGNEGTEVMAAAAGTVEEIKDSPEMGKTVVIDHGNGWKTTYGQLQDDINVKVNDVVTKGDSIGEVNKPTKYSVNLGEHVDFKVTKDGQSVNPEKILE